MKKTLILALALAFAGTQAIAAEPAKKAPAKTAPAKKAEEPKKKHKKFEHHAADKPKKGDKPKKLAPPVLTVPVK